ncbi:hypothetical protein [Sulfitobacter alexandrii]|uniref:hypothetical protein n=1 Tax=Sulfitobacter alexandrii TaxID=1917485 RepID=UPI0012EC6CA9|nr:hypothetical protein [Sulfitobacter alexandrii]
MSDQASFDPENATGPNPCFDFTFQKNPRKGALIGRAIPAADQASRGLELAPRCNPVKLLACRTNTLGVCQ